jgi:hypothetical protein
MKYDYLEKIQKRDNNEINYFRTGCKKGYHFYSDADSEIQQQADKLAYEIKITAYPTRLKKLKKRLQHIKENYPEELI